MKEKEMIEIAEHRFKTIHKLSPKIIKEFNVTDIHKFRIEVKKLRAFLRLADVGKEVDASLIPKRLKTFYGYAGIVRNIQLHRQYVFKYITNYGIEEPATYIEILDQEKSYWQKEAADLMEGNDFKDDEKKIIKQLPGKLEKSSVKIFVKNKLDELKEQLKELRDDNAIHNLRKILKDILYNCDIIKAHAVLPGMISEEDNLETLTSALGGFRDKCFGLDFLQSEYLDKIKDSGEQSRLMQMKNAFEKEKQTMKQQLQTSLRKLQAQL